MLMWKALPVFRHTENFLHLYIYKYIYDGVICVAAHAVNMCSGLLTGCFGCVTYYVRARTRVVWAFSSYCYKSIHLRWLFF